MRIWVRNRSRKLAFDFVSCSLLRDNVQHHIEGRNSKGDFLCTHALADLIWTKEDLVIQVGPFRDELRAAWRFLERIPCERLAISLRTRAALEGLVEPPAVTGTILHSLTNWTLPFDTSQLRTLGDLLHAVVFDLFLSALHPCDGGIVHATFGHRLQLVTLEDCDQDSKVQEMQGSLGRRRLDS